MASSLEDELEELFGEAVEGGGEEDEVGESGEELDDAIELPPSCKTADERVMVLRLPMSTSYAGRAFRPDLHSHEIETEELSKRHKADSVARETMIRWRFREGDPTRRESNTRIVRWSDGSATMYIGKFAYELRTEAVHDSHGLLLGQRPGHRLEGDEEVDTGAYLESCGRVAARAVLRPLQAIATREMVLAKREQASKRLERVKVLETATDPALALRKRVQQTDEMNRAREAERLRQHELKNARRPARASDSHDDDDHVDGDGDGDEALLFDDEDLDQLKSSVRRERFRGDEDDDDDDDDDDEDAEDEEDDEGRASKRARDTQLG